MTRPTRSGNTGRDKCENIISHTAKNVVLTVDEVITDNGAIAETPEVNEPASAIDLVRDSQNVPNNLEAILTSVQAGSL